MRIAYVGNFSQQHCTEVHIALTLEQLGHEVIRIQETPSRTDDFWVNKVLLPQRADLFLFTRTWGNMVTLQDLEVLKMHKIPTASYHLDLYVGLKREDGLDNDPFWRTDFVFTPDGSEMAAKVFNDKGINHHYIKPGVFRGECYIKEGTEKYDVVFVGGGQPTGKPIQYGHTEWPYRGQLLKFLDDTYKHRYKKFGNPEPTIRNDALNQLYADSKVVVGDSLCLNFDHPYYWSDRVYETLGRGGFIIHPYIKGMEEEFEDGQDIVFYQYNDFEGLKEKIDYYLEHPAQRKAIMMNGHNLVKRKCTYHNRLIQALSIIFDSEPKDVVGHYKKKKGKMNNGLKINLGSGADPYEGYVNVDIVDIEGVDKVWNLANFPWPFEDNSATHIRAADVIEHMPSHTKDMENTVIKFIEECHRILKPGGELWIQTPGWNAEFMWIDPTHVRGFHKESMDFFDPDKPFGQTTGFYSPAKFKVEVEELENHNLRFTMIKR